MAVPTQNEARTVLVAEDDENDALLLRYSFQKAGLHHRVIHLRDGDETITYLQQVAGAAQCLPDLLLLDLKMPRLNGFDVLTWLQTQPTLKSMAVVIFSSSNLAEDMAKARALGAKDYLVKPADADQWIPMAKTLNARWFGGAEG